MKLRNKCRLLIFGILTLGLGSFVSCNAFNEDLPECRLFVKFKYDYNMQYADAFHTQVDKVELYVFDREGRFLFSQTEEGEVLTTGNYRMPVELPFGEYRFLAWAGHGDSYHAPQLTVGTSITEARLKLKRPASLIVDTQLEQLWYGEIIDVNFTGKTNQVEVINLIKDTNVITFQFQSVSPYGWGIELEDYEFEIFESNGYLDYDNSLMQDDMLTYKPYYEKQLSDEGVKVEFAIMRLLEDRQTRMIVTEKASNVQVFNISLRDYLGMTLSQYQNMEFQEYLDRQWEWHIVFFLSDSWVATQININDWTWYRQFE